MEVGSEEPGLLLYWLSVQQRGKFPSIRYMLGTMLLKLLYLFIYLLFGIQRGWDWKQTQGYSVNINKPGSLHVGFTYLTWINKEKIHKQKHTKNNFHSFQNKAFNKLVPVLPVFYFCSDSFLKESVFCYFPLCLQNQALYPSFKKDSGLQNTFLKG